MKVPGIVRRVFLPSVEKEEDGRDTWPSRTAFILAAMGGAIGIGNLLRYPSVVFANNGLQWFIPYLIALVFLAVPLLILEISIGQSYRGGTVVAFGTLARRTKGVGLGVAMNGYFVVCYYVPILAWAMKYFRHSFTSPLPWTTTDENPDAATNFYYNSVIANVDPRPGNYTPEDSFDSVVDYAEYPGTGMVAETVGWIAFVFFLVFLCLYNGVGVTGRAVYFTMGLPIVMVFVLMGRALSLDNATRGVKYYFAEWHGSKLASGDIWQAACGQIFFSIGVGFGYYTTYASYNTRYANAVQDSIIIAASNSLYEVVAAFAVFGVVGFLDLKPGTDELGTFSVGFLTYPTAIAEMDGANFWAVVFFLTILLLGISSAFALIESVITLICDTAWGRHYPRPAVAGTVMVVSFLISLMYATQFGYYLLDAVDTWVNTLSLVLIVWCECISASVVYRSKDVFSQVGVPAFAIHNLGYIGAQIFGVAVAHAVDPWAGAVMAFGLYFVCLIASLLIAKTPDTPAPRFWGRNKFLAKFWWMAIYSINQLRRDLNVTVAHRPGNWAIPAFWGPVIRYVSAPILMMVLSFAYPDFYKKRADPLHIFGFTIAHLTALMVVIGFLVPRFLNVFLPPERWTAGEWPVAPGVTMGTVVPTDSAEKGTSAAPVDRVPADELKHKESSGEY